MTDIDSNEPTGGPSTYQVEVQLRQSYIEHLERIGDADAALEALNKEIIAGDNGDRDSANFFTKPGQVIQRFSLNSKVLTRN